MFTPLIKNYYINIVQYARFFSTGTQNFTLPGLVVAVRAAAIANLFIM